MSYDLRFAVKAENGQYVVFRTPEYDTPTYNVGEIFRKSMGFDFEQSKFYKVSEIKEHLIHGLNETRFNAEEYRNLEPENGWGSVETVYKSLNSVLNTIEEIEKWDKLPLECVYLSW